MLLLLLVIAVADEVTMRRLNSLLLGEALLRDGLRLLVALHQGGLPYKTRSHALHRSMLMLVQDGCRLQILLDVVLVSSLEEELSDLRIGH